MVDSPTETTAPGHERPHGTTRLLYRITQELKDGLDSLEEALEKTVHHMADYGFNRSTIALQDSSNGEVRLEVTHGFSEAERKKGRFRKGEGIVGRVLVDGQAAVVPSIASEPDFVDRTGVRANIDQSRTAFICVPIVTVKGETVGALSADVPGGDEEGHKWDRRLLTVVASLIGEAVRYWRDQREEDAAFGKEMEAPGFTGVEQPRDLVGNSRAMSQVVRLMQQVAPSGLSVLIRGESGTGKEVIARAIHAASNRSNGAFVSVNCGALPEQLVESELFGHVRGAFTGALQDRRGRFELANGGTIFLDEIGDLPLPVQVNLLRVLQEGEIYRVGEEQPRRVDVRILAATHKDLETAIEDGSFREDLFYRLNVFPLYVPALRERRTDITLLADHFVEKHSKLQGREVTRISTPAIDLMCAYHWPGNVRELENCIERCVLLAMDGVIRDHHLPPTLQTGLSSGTTKAGSLESMVMSFEREIIIEAMKNAHGNMSAAARALETTPRILAYRLRKLDLHDTLAVRRRR